MLKNSIIRFYENYIDLKDAKKNNKKKDAVIFNK